MIDTKVAQRHVSQFINWLFHTFGRGYIVYEFSHSMAQTRNIHPHRIRPTNTHRKSVGLADVFPRNKRKFSPEAQFMLI